MMVCVDFGNTLVKAGIFEQGKMLNNLRTDYEQLHVLHSFIVDSQVSEIAVCNVSGKGDSILSELAANLQIHHLTSATALPFINEYKTPLTLGTDRIAAVAGAHMLFPETTCLIIDCGTCMTTDVITHDGVYKGGSISPGLQMRLKSMHTFTGKLPELDFKIPESITGNSTAECMFSGAFHGMIAEIGYFAEHYAHSLGSCQLVLSGGDAELFAEHLNLNIFAAPDLVLYGLYQIYRQHDS